MIRLKPRILPAAAGQSACNRSRLLSLVIGLVLGAFLLLPTAPLVAGSTGSLDLADEPMMASIKPAPANIMFLLDDSGSMLFEILIKGEYDGRYPSPLDTSAEKKNGFCFIFDDMQDTYYRWDDNKNRTDEYNIRYMLAEYRSFWQSQFFAANVMYYNPATTYEPWPGYPGRIFAPADKENPLPHPFKTGVSTLDLDAESFSVSSEAGPTLVVKHAHYFVKSATGDVYLVVIDGVAKSILYYRVTQFEGAGMKQKIKKVRLETNPPEEIITGRTYDQERQNFANWFTYYRRREYVAKNAIARVIKSLHGVRVGILGINGQIIVPLKPLGIWKEGAYYDETTKLLDKLYAYNSGGGTPLREGLNDVGRYYKDNSYELKHYKGGQVKGDAPPYYTEVDGGACQQSFTIIMTDGYYSYDVKDLGVDNADGDNDSDYDGGLYKDGLEETLADVAMYYYENDLNSLDDRVYDPQRVNHNMLDKNPHQHMVTYGVAFGVTGNLNPDDYNDNPTSENYLKNTEGQYPNWPTSIGVRSKETIDDLYHATVNGRGDFLTAGDPQQLADALVQLMNNILGRLGSSSSVSINGDSLYGKISDNVLVFQASYQTSDWSGDVKAFGVDTFTGSILADNPKWSAAASLDQLNGQGLDNRNILSSNGSYGIPFVYDAGQMTVEQRKALGWDGVVGSASEQEAEKVVEFIRGHAIEGFRSRNSRLGDIIHASPVFENDVLYAGANDGMLHAFEINVDSNGEVSGEEIFAYVPGFVYQNLADLTDPNYAHKYFVDLTPTVKKGASLLGGTEDETILVGGLGKGGKGYFALNITDPRAMDVSKVLWEFPNTATAEEDIKDMGYSFSKPVVVPSNDETHPWIVIFGNGYDSPGGRAALFIVNPASGEVVQKIIAENPDTPVPNGLSSPTPVDIDLDGKVDFVFAGDLQGNMWKFDLTAEDSALWTMAYGGPPENPQPLFTARGPGGTIQPITSKPEVMLHPEKHGLMVLFGTGKFLGNSDFTDNTVQTIYGIWDYGDRAFFPGQWGRYSNDDDSEYLGVFNRNSTPELSNQPPTVTLLEQTSQIHTVTIFDENDNPVEIEVRVMSGDTPTWKNEDEDPAESEGRPNLPNLSSSVDNHAGWFWDLPEDGERVISDVLLRDGRLIVIAFTPDPDRCSAGGSSFLMELNAFNGGSFGGSIFDLDDNRLFDTKDSVIVGYDAKTGKPIRAFPTGVKMQGNIQPPAILRLNNLIEVKYLSSSTGAVYKLNERAVRLGMTYWKELEQ